MQCRKKSLRLCLQNRTVARKVLKTALVEAEGMLNSQPITHVSSYAGDIEALTSNHFLLLPANPSSDDADDNERDQLNETMATVPSALVNFMFWKRFAKEYIPSLIERKKWKEKRKNLKEADVVLVAEPNQRRGIWPLGRMGSTHPGQDGVVRAVTVRTQYGEHKRPITKLCFLEEGETYNPRHIGWDSWDVFCPPNVGLHQLASQKQTTQLWEGKNTTFCRYMLFAPDVPT